MSEDYEYCAACGGDYFLRDGCVPTKYCDPCAHKIAEREPQPLTDADRETAAWCVYGGEGIGKWDQVSPAMKRICIGGLLRLESELAKRGLEIRRIAK